jgi:hypothetical protein
VNIFILCTHYIVVIVVVIVFKAKQFVAGREKTRKIVADDFDRRVIREQYRTVSFLFKARCNIITMKISLKNNIGFIMKCGTVKDPSSIYWANKKMNKIFSGTQPCQLVAGRNRRFGNYLCPHHQPTATN